jgi:hypothetical protein
MVFTDHLLRGFSPPGSKKFQDVLNFFNLHPQDLAPNSISNLCQFQVLCEVYFQMEATDPSSRSFSASTVRQNVLMSPAWNSAGSRFRGRETALFLQLLYQVILRDGLRLGFITRTQPQLMRIPYRVIDLTVFPLILHFLAGIQKNMLKSPLHTPNSGPYWPMA